MWLLGAIIGIAVLSIPALWVVVLIRRDGSAELAARLARLETRVAALQHAVDGAAAARAEAATPPPPPAAAPISAEAPAAAPSAIPQTPAAPPPSPPPEATKASRERLEDVIMRRWAVWLGGLALALGGIFLVKYSIEQGYFGPTARVTAGLLLGLVLLLVSEAARRRPLAAPLGPVPVDYVPPALAAAAIVVLFASLYVAYAVYDLIAPALAFLLLAGVALGGAALSLVHGVFLALLGLAGAYVVPFLVSTNDPSVPRLLAYVLVVTAGCLFLVRWRAWPWLGWTAVVGSGLWTVLALAAAAASDEAWIGVFLLLLAPLFPAVAGEEGRSRARSAVIWSGAALSTLLMLALALWADTDAMSLTFAWVLTALYAAIGVRWPRFDRLPWLVAAMQLLILAGWVFGEAGTSERIAALVTLPAGPALRPYLLAAVALAAAAGAGGFAMLARAPQPQRWAALSAVTPLAALAIVYWRVEQLSASLPWATLALVLAAAFLAATEYVAVRRATPGYTNALAYYALAVTGALALALTFSLRLGWLSVALSLELPAIAWLCERTGVRVLRHAAFVLGAIVLVRLLLNPSVADYDLGTWPILNGLLYTYGIPALAFAATARWLGRDRHDNTVLLLEAGALALTMALITLQIRHLVGGGRIDGDHYGLLEQALQTDAWLAVGYALLVRSGAGGSSVREFGWRIIAGIGAANLVFGVCLGANPLLRPEPVGDLPILNVLLLAYAVPAGLGVLYHRAFERRGFRVLARGAGIAALALAFIYLSLETRHLFWGSRLGLGAASDGEWYAYSAVWLAYAAALLASGIAWRMANLRLAGLVIGAIVAAKAFLFDMAALTGLYRAASFLGLGASLVAIAWLYQRVAASPRQSPP